MMSRIVATSSKSAPTEPVIIQCVKKSKAFQSFVSTIIPHAISANPVATDSMAPASQLARIGITPVGKLAYELADGRLIEYEFGLAQIDFMGDITAGRVIFGPDDAEPLLGVTQLESAGIVIDPRTGNLKRLPAIPLKHLAAIA